MTKANQMETSSHLAPHDAAHKQCSERPNSPLSIGKADTTVANKKKEKKQHNSDRIQIMALPPTTVSHMQC